PARGSSIAEKHVVNVSIQVPLPHKEETLRILFAMKIHMRFPWDGKGTIRRMMGGSPQAERLRHAPSTTPLRVAVPLPVPGRS
ncbi:MAG: hypothetical protein JWL96_1725, partial [Sphingomonas bacterium]|nr:hypothetical protein [Sphingomonas bacterium]